MEESSGTKLPLSYGVFLVGVMMKGIVIGNIKDFLKFKRSISGGGTETEQDPVGLLAQKPFHVPRFLFVGNRLQPP